MRTFRAGPSATFILVGLLAAACVTTAPAATGASPTSAPTVAATTSTAVPPTAGAPTLAPTDAPTAAVTDKPAETPTSAPTDPPGPDPTRDPWTTTATQYRGNDAQRYTIECPPNGSEGVVWGTTFYTDDSSICTAAVHRGAITLAQGGTVTYEIAPGQTSYEGTVQNGVTSRSYATWGGTFVIVIDP